LRHAVMSAMTLARVQAWCSGGKGRRVGDPAADDARGARELDPVGVDVGSVAARQIRALRGVMGQQVAVDFLADGVRLFNRRILAGPRRWVLSWSLPDSCSHRW